MGQHQTTFRQLAELRLAEAELLLAKQFWSGAYYLAGYSLECALKAKIASSFRENEIPELKRVQRIYSHDLSSLLGLSGLKDELEAEMEKSAELRKYWTIAKEWSEQARYEIWTQERAAAILEAVGGGEGLLRWLLERLQA
jgi:HEPN domain-containing protein